jgi:glycosyltransferase involved in cell wall biosynthesis
VDIFWSLRADRPDVVHLFWGHYPCLVGFLVQRHLRPTALSVFLGAYDLLRQFPGSALVACRADVVWTHAKCNVPALIGLGVSPTKIRVVYRGVDVAQFPMRDTAKVKGRVVTAGRLHPEKAMDDVLVAFSRILVTWPHGSMMVLGEGRDRSRLDGLVDSLGMCAHVTFRGHLSQDQVREEMSAAEVFVLMSRNASERLPNVVKEAMASGCVCVVTRTPGIDELVQDGVNGFVVEQGDVEAAARRISMALRTPERAAAMRAAAREWIVKRFDVTRSVALYRRRWEELVAERRLPPQTGMQARMRGRQRGATGTASARP